MAVPKGAVEFEAVEEAGGEAAEQVLVLGDGSLGEDADVDAYEMEPCDDVDADVEEIELDDAEEWWWLSGQRVRDGKADVELAAAEVTKALLAWDGQGGLGLVGR